MAPPQILIVDDDTWIVWMVSRELVGRGYRTVTASNGAEAVRRANGFPCDLIIADIGLPDIDGWALVRKLRAQSSLATVPTIFLTTRAAGDVAAGFRADSDGYLTKPFRFDELDARVAEVLARRQTPGRTPIPAAVVGEAPPAAATAGAAAGSATPQPANGKGIHGVLDQIGLSSLLVMVEMERKSGILVLQCQGVTGRLFAARGQIVAARIEGNPPLQGPDAVYRLLGWSEGRFDFTPLQVEMTDQIGLTVQHLLMEGARRIDEAKLARPR